VIIAGGTGLIGRALAADLARDGHEPVLLSRRPERHAGSVPAGARLAAWDPEHPAGLAAALAGGEAVVNLAGASIAGGLWTERRKALIRDSRLRAGEALARAIEAMANRPRVLVQASAVGYYGARPVGTVDEASPPGDDFLARVCVDWEASTRPVEALGVRRVVIRTGLPLSREGGALPPILLPFRLFAGGRMGSGRQPFPWIHMNDEVGAIRFLIDHQAAEGPYNLAAPERLDNAAFSRLVGRVMGRPVWLPAPAFALRLALGEMAGLILDGQAMVPSRLLEAGYRFQFPQAEPALRDLLRDR
jgi:uncharacterized protein (TIGR01777 family)